MSLTGGHLDAFLEAGLTAEQIVALVKADITERERAASGRRAKDAERQRRHRESRDVTVTNGESQPVTDKGSLEVSPPAPPLPKPSKQSPLSPPKSKELPDWLPRAEWAAFREVRKAMRSVPFTATAEKGIISDLDKLRGEGHDVRKVLMKAVKSGYRGVFGDKDTMASAPKAAVTAQALRERAEWFVRHGQPDQANECREKAIKLEQARAA